MNKLMIAALAAGFLVSAAGAAFAQAAVESGTAPEDPNTPSIAVEAGAPVDLQAPETQTKVSIVLLSEVKETETPFDMTEDADELAALQASIENNEAIKAKLNAGGYAIDEVAGVVNNVDGSTIVYVDDRG